MEKSIYLDKTVEYKDILTELGFLHQIQTDTYVLTSGWTKLEILEDGYISLCNIRGYEIDFGALDALLKLEKEGCLKIVNTPDECDMEQIAKKEREMEKENYDEQVRKEYYTDRI